MKSTIKSIVMVLLTVLLILYVGVAVFVTACLLNYNDYGITEFGKKSLVIVDEDFSKNYKKGDLLVVTKGSGDKVSVGDFIFFYNPAEETTINYAEVSDVTNTDGHYTFIVGNDYNVYDSYYVGKDIKVFHGLGNVLSVLESEFGFLALIILPTMIAIIFEIYAIILEVAALKKEA